jgi:glycerol-3-phosphate acyltransferase PlsY
MGIEAVLVIGGAYLLGSIPFGVIFSRWLKGIDPREQGSRNIGFTNVLRTAGRLPGGLTLIGDMGKGTISVVLVRILFPDERLMLIAGLASVLGHNHSLFLKLKGGKGVATGMGVLLGLDPRLGLMTIAVWVAVVLIWRFSSLGAIVSFGVLPAVAWLFHPNLRYLLFSIVISLMVLVRHRSNMVRLWQGVESKIGSS